MQVKDDAKPYDTINVTPMLDLAYVLIVVFIVMSTASVSGLKIDLPKPSNKPSTNKPAEVRIVQIKPDGSLLLAADGLRALSGERVLLQGPSGSGKSSLFRTLAGIWPFASGAVQRSPDAMFIPQRPYFPNGALREALAYPEMPARYSDAELRKALHAAQLPELAADLDRQAAWGQTLSGGEQQRLAIARVLLKRPAWVFADEATSALDDATQSAVYAQLVAMTTERGGGMVSIAHREGLAQFHTRSWVLEPAPNSAGFVLR